MRRRDPFVPDAKLTNYLLDPAHSTGRHKYRLLAACGFHEKSPDRLKSALLRHYFDGAREVQDTPFGTKIEVFAQLQCPNPKANLAVISVWMVRRGETRPQFVTIRPRRNAPG